MDTQTHWKQNFDYKYTGAYELKEGETRTLTIKRLCREDVQSTNGSKQTCLVVYFEEHSKPMVLNKTNCKTIEKLYSPFVEEWPGKRITIEARKVNAFGEEVDALRIKKTVPKSAQKQDFSAAFDKLTNCKTLDELKTVYSELSAEEKAATIQLKDQLKDKFGGQNANS